MINRLNVGGSIRVSRCDPIPSQPSRAKRHDRSCRAAREGFFVNISQRGAHKKRLTMSWNASGCSAGPPWLASGRMANVSPGIRRTIDRLVAIDFQSGIAVAADRPDLKIGKRAEDGQVREERALS